MFRDSGNMSLLSEAKEMARSEYRRARADRDRVLDVLETGRRKVFLRCLAGTLVAGAALFLLLYFLA